MGILGKGISFSTPITPTSTNIPQASTNKTPRDIYDDVFDSQGQFSKAYPLPGIYPIIRIDSVKMIVTKKSGDTMFIANTEILQSNVVDRPVGSRMPWICNMRNKPAWGAVKSFIAAAAGCTLEELTANDIREACGVANPLYGRLLRLEAVMGEKKEGKEPFTSCSWCTVADDLQVQSDELRKAAGFM